MAQAPVERRTHPRRRIVAGLQLRHQQSGLSFPCRCVDISPGGARLAVPPTMPVRAGHTVVIDGLAAAAPDLAFPPAAGAAEVVRVDRECLVTQGHLVIAVRFDG